MSKLLREYIKVLLEADCPEPDRFGGGQYYNIDPQNPTTVEEVLECWITTGGKVYDDSMPAMYTPEELTPYREYRAGELRNSIGSKYYNELKKSIEQAGIKEPLHIDLGKNGGVKIGEGNHRHEIATGLGLAKLPVIFHFKQDVSLTKQQLDKDVDDIMDMLGF